MHSCLVNSSCLIIFCSKVTRDCDNAAEQLKVMVNETVLYNSYCHSLKRRNHQSYCDQQTMVSYTCTLQYWYLYC